MYPLSPMQQGILFHSLLEPNSGAYIVQTSFELCGNLDIPAFSQSWQQLIDRHSILRTAFVWQNLEQPLQVVGKTAKITLIEHDWQNISLIEQPEKLATFLQEDKKTDFNLNKAPLMRLNLIKMLTQKNQNPGAKTYKLIWTYHHLLLDGWSVPLLIKELLNYYQSLSQNIDISITPATPYKNYIAWLKQQNQDQARDFWRQELKDFYAPTSLEITTDIDNEADSNYLQHKSQLSAETTFKLEFLAREYQLTLNTLIQGAWAILLHRYTGYEDIVFGATSSGRSTKLDNAQTMVGLFINTLPVRVQIDCEKLLIYWLQQLQKKQIARQEYEYTSLIDINRVSEVPRDVPLFQSIVVFENYPIESSLKQSLATFNIRDIQISEQTNYPLTLYVTKDDQLSLKILYKAKLFDARSITNLLGHFKTLLEEIASDPQQKLGQLNILTALEKEQLLTQAKSNSKEYPQNYCFHQLFEAQVVKTPEAVAAIYEEESITYQELDSRANAIANNLQKLGVKPETLVGIYCDRSLAMLVGLLAILKAGGAYVPLDPTYPRSRLDYIVEDSQINIILTETKYEPTFRDRNLTILNLDSPCPLLPAPCSDALADAPANPLGNPLGLLPAPCSLLSHPNNLAYVIYTSGSTGKPKGVQVTHRNLVNFLWSMKEKPGITAKDILLSVTTISFDIAALELYLPLIVGAKVVIAPTDITSSDRDLATRIEDYQITMMQATPITWRMLLADNWQGNQQLKILSGGEALEPKLAQQLITKGKEVWNLYGPTETTIWSSLSQLKADENQDIQKVFLGNAIANTQLYVLDSQLRLVPPGVIGELYIAGSGLARGYRDRPDLTAEKFIPNPFSVISSDSSAPSTRLYKTGDRVRWNLDGNLEYIGRVDRQIKFRGFRIELGEIETTLTKYPEIETAIVILQGVDLEQRLVAYILPQEKSNLVDENTSKIQSFLQEKLPYYMIPSNYVTLKELPLTPNGKIDHLALTKIETSSQRLNTHYQKPQTEIERAIASIWQDVLQIDRASLTDNFFDLGGQSLLMIRVHSKLKEQLAIDISLINMFRYPTIASLAQYLNQKNSQEELLEIQQKPKILAGKNRLQQLRRKRNQD